MTLGSLGTVWISRVRKRLAIPAVLSALVLMAAAFGVSSLLSRPVLAQQANAVAIGPVGSEPNTKREEAYARTDVGISIDLAISTTTEVFDLQFAVEFDALRVEYVDASSQLDAGFAGCAMQAFAPESGGRVNVAIVCPSAHTGDVRLMALAFKAQGVPQDVTTTISVVDAKVFSGDGSQLPLDGNAPTAAPVVLTILRAVCGDVDDNDVVDDDVRDVVGLLQYIVGMTQLTPKQLYQANVVGEGIDVADAGAILRHIADGTVAQLTCTVPTTVQPLAK